MVDITGAPLPVEATNSSFCDEAVTLQNNVDISLTDTVPPVVTLLPPGVVAFNPAFVVSASPGACSQNVGLVSPEPPDTFRDGQLFGGIRDGRTTHHARRRGVRRQFLYGQQRDALSVRLLECVALGDTRIGFFSDRHDLASLLLFRCHCERQLRQRDDLGDRARKPAAFARVRTRADAPARRDGQRRADDSDDRQRPRRTIAASILFMFHPPLLPAQLPAPRWSP